MIDLKHKKILITGANGFLGKHIVRNLTEKRRVPDVNIFAPRAEELDLRKKENTEKAVRGKDVVIHLASVTGGIEFHKDHPGEMFYDNLMMGVHLMEAARCAEVEKFVTIGSATEYPAAPPVPFLEANIWYGRPEETHVPYAVAKKMLMVQAQAYRQEYGFHAIHLLLTNMFGPGEKKDSTFVIPSLIRRISEAKRNNAPSVEVWGTGKATRDFLYVEDAAEGILLAAERYDDPEPANIGSGIEISIRELAEMLCRLMEYRGRLRWDSSKPEGQLRRLLDISRAQRGFGFKPVASLEDGLRKTIEWHLANTV